MTSRIKMHLAVLVLVLSLAFASFLPARAFAEEYDITPPQETQEPSDSKEPADEQEQPQEPGEGQQDPEEDPEGDQEEETQAPVPDDKPIDIPTPDKIDEAVKEELEDLELPDLEEITTPIAPLAKNKKFRFRGSVYKVTVKGSQVKFVHPVNKKVKTAVVPSVLRISGRTYKVTAVGKKAFKNCKDIRKVVVGANIKSIGHRAFAGCKKLRYVLLGADVRFIGGKAFYKTKSLNEIEILSKNLKKVKKDAFKGSRKKLVVDVPSSKEKAYKKLFSKKTGFGKHMKVK